MAAILIPQEAGRFVFVLMMMLMIFSLFFVLCPSLVRVSRARLQDCSLGL
jgi:hypothetical protein